MWIFFINDQTLMPVKRVTSIERHPSGLDKCIRTVYPKKYAHGFVVLCFVVVMQSFIMNSHEVFIHIHQGCFAGTGAIVRLPQCQWSKHDGYGKISQCITTTKHSKAQQSKNRVHISWDILYVIGVWQMHVHKQILWHVIILMTIHKWQNGKPDTGRYIFSYVE